MGWFFFKGEREARGISGGFLFLLISHRGGCGDDINKGKFKDSLFHPVLRDGGVFCVLVSPPMTEGNNSDFCLKEQESHQQEFSINAQMSFRRVEKTCFTERSAMKRKCRWCKDLRTRFYGVWRFLKHPGCDSTC